MDPVRSRTMHTLRPDRLMLAIALLASACDSAAPEPSGQAAMPARLAAPAPKPEQEFVLVAPDSLVEAESVATVEALLVVEEPGGPSAPAPAVAQSFAPAGSATAPKPPRAHKGAVARDRTGKVKGKGPKRADRPEVSQGSRGELSVPFKGRKLRTPGGSEVRKQAEGSGKAEKSGAKGTPPAGPPRR